MNRRYELVYVDSRKCKLTVNDERVTVKISNDLSAEDAAKMENFLARISNQIPMLGFTIRGQANLPISIQMRSDSGKWSKMYR